MVFHPLGLRPSIVNWDEVARHLLGRAERELGAFSDDSTGVELLTELRGFGIAPHPPLLRWSSPSFGGASCCGIIGAASMQPFTIDVLGRWSYAFCVALYVLLLVRLIWYFRRTLRFTVRRVYVTLTVYVLLILGFFFEWMADIFFVWDFPEGRHLFKLAVPVFGWVTGHRVPVEELVWIATVVPLFYFLYLYSTLLFHDIVYVVDENGRFYKREERWVGFTRATKIAQRRKGERGQEHEVLVQRRPPGFFARWLGRHFNEPPPRRVV